MGGERGSGDLNKVMQPHYGTVALFIYLTTRVERLSRGQVSHTCTHCGPVFLDVEFAVCEFFSLVCFMCPGEARKWMFVCEASTVEIECDSNRQLSQKLKLRLLDKFGNTAECPSDVEPLLNIEHSSSKQ